MVHQVVGARALPVPQVGAVVMFKGPTVDDLQHVVSPEVCCLYDVYY